MKWTNARGLSGVDGDSAEDFWNPCRRLLKTTQSSKVT